GTPALARSPTSYRASAHGSDAAEGQARLPSCHYPGQYRNRPINRRIAPREIGHLGVDPDLFDTQGRGLPAHHIMVPRQEDLDEVAAGRHVGGKGDRGAKQPLAEEGDLADFGADQPDALLLLD